MILRVLIRALAHLVPAIRRADWRERWSGELWSAADQKISGWRLAPGMLLDGLVEFRHGFDEGWTMSGLVGDCRLACRRAIRTPLSSCLLVGVTAVGASASSTLFSLVDFTLFRAPAQVVAPEELIQIGRGDARTFDNFSYPAYQAFRDGLRGTVDVAAYANATVLVGEGADRRQVRGQWVSSSYFAVLGTPLVRDAGLTDDSPGVVVADWFWKEYRSAIEAAGMALVINGDHVRVLGIAPPRFSGVYFGTDTPAFWGTLALSDRAADLFIQWDHSWLWIIGRRVSQVPGGSPASVQQTRTAVTAVHAGLGHGASTGSTVTVVEGLGLRPAEREEIRPLAFALLAAGGLILLIAAANVAGLQLARARADARLTAIRYSLGASHGRLVRAMLVDQALLASAGGLLAWLATGWTLQWLQARVPYDLAVTLRPDGRLLLFALLSSVGVNLLVTAVPIWRATRPHLMQVLKRTRSPRTTMSGFWLTTQLALAALLVSVSTLLAQSLSKATEVDTGLRTDNVLVMSLRWPSTNRPSSIVRADLLTDLRSQPTVVSAGFASRLPIVSGQRTMSVSQPGVPDTPFEDSVLTAVFEADRGFFDVLGLSSAPGLGPALDRWDTVGAEDARPIIVTHAFSTEFWPAHRPTDAVVQLGGDPFMVVGEVGDFRSRSLRSPASAAAIRPFPSSQLPAVLLVRVRPGFEAAPHLRQLVSTHSDVAILNVATYDDLLRASLAETALAARVAIPFAIVGLLMAGAGLYGAVARRVAGTRHETGIRLALGATAGDILRQEVGLAGRMGLIGGILGILLTAAFQGALRPLLFGIGGLDIAVAAAAALVMGGLGLVAAWLPARQAARTDPLAVLRSESN